MPSNCALFGGLQSVHGFRCYDNSAEREMSSSASTRTMPGGIIARSGKRWYLSYSEADFDVLRPARATCCIDGGEIWHGGVN